MRLLLVEDHNDFARSIEQALANIPDCEVVWVRSRDAAVAALAREAFDLVILDRRIPSTDDALDDHADHGWRVFQVIRAEAPGTPVLFLTGTVDPDFATDFLNEHSRNEDIYGTRTREPMYQVFWKRRADECVAAAREVAQGIAALERIAIDMPEGPPLRAGEERVVRIFGRRFNAASAQVVVMGGGLSDSRVLKVTTRHADGALIATAVAKIAKLPTIHDEATRFQGDISRLTTGGFPGLTETVSVGAGNHGGLFYGMVGETVESAFDRLRAQHADAPRLPSDIRAVERPWYAAKQSANVAVSRIRRCFIRDTDIPAIRGELADIDIGPMEVQTIEAARCCQHGDLHCANVVFDGRGNPMLIDFGDVGISFASVDPVCLELSTAFHPQRSKLPGDWPTEAGMLDWADLDAYLRGCSFADFIRGCRTWAFAEAASPEEVYAVAYGFALRQLRYPDTNKALARALIRACIAKVVD